MIPISFAEASFRTKTENGQDFIFDTIRKKWLLLTTEEWVRQNFIRYLVEQKKYPVTLIALEKEIRLGELKKRFDILVYNKDHEPWMMVECKSPSVNLSNDVLQQVLRYNISVPVRYLVITNGNSTIGWIKNEKGIELIPDLPAFFK